LTKLLVSFTYNVPFYHLPATLTLFQPITYGLGLGLAASGFAIIVKLMKNLYLKQKENERLQQQ
jgi:hypothetical protein